MHSLSLKWPTAKVSALIYSQLIQNDKTRKELHMNYVCGNMSIISVIVSPEAPKWSGHSKLARGNNLEI